MNFDNESLREQRKRSLYKLHLASGVVLGPTYTLFFAYHTAWLSLIPFLIYSLVTFACLLSEDKKREGLCERALCISFWLAPLATMITTGGIYSPVGVWLVLSLAITHLVMGKKWFLWMSIGTVTSLVALGFLQSVIDISSEMEVFRFFSKFTIFNLISFSIYGLIFALSARSIFKEQKTTNGEKRNFVDTLHFKLGATVLIFIFLIEIVMLVVSVNHRVRAIRALNLSLIEKIQRQTGVQVESVFTHEELNTLPKEYAKNIVLSTILIIAFCTIGFILAFHSLAGRHLIRLIQFNRIRMANKLMYYDPIKIPDNAVGDVMSSQNDLIKNIRHLLSFPTNNPGPVMQLTYSGEVNFANQHSLEIFGSEIEDGVTEIGLLMPDLEWNDALEACLFYGSYETEIQTQGGPYLVVFKHVIETKEINLYGLSLERQKALQEQLIQTSKLASIGELAAGVGHEINNPLTILQLSLEKYELETKKLGKDIDFRTNKFLIDQRKMIDRIKNIVKELKIYAHSTVEESGIFPLNETINNSSELVRSIFSIEGVELVSNITSENMSIVGNRGKLQQVVMNLLTNAKDACTKRPNSLIELQLKKDEDHAVLIVKDNGVGISKSCQDNVFESFFTTKGVGKGTGVGLSICKQIVSDLGGEISFSSEENIGTEFVVKLPISENVHSLVDSPSLHESNQKSMSSGERILLVEDEPILNELICFQLEELGLEVVAASNGEEAMLELQTKKFDLMLTDLKMPVKNGLELIKDAGSVGLLNSIRVYVMSGQEVESFPSYEKSIFDKYVHQFLEKPFTEETLARVINEFRAAEEEFKKSA